MENPEVDGHPDLTRDSGSGAIINRNTYSYQQYMENRNKMLSDKERLDSLENDIHDIKTMLKTFLEANG